MTMDDQSTSKSGSKNADNTAGTLEIRGKQRSPEIILDPGKGFLSIKGCSIPENVNQFYAPVLEALEGYIQNPAKKTRVVFDLEYVNSTSSQLLLALLYKLRELVDQGYGLTIEWHYMMDDEDIYETGKSYSELSGLTFNFYEHQHQ